MPTRLCTRVVSRWKARSVSGTAPSIKFSLTLPRFHEPGSRDPFRKAFDFARHVEQLGYYTGFVGHHHFTPETLDPRSLYDSETRTIKVRQRVTLPRGFNYKDQWIQTLQVQQLVWDPAAVDAPHPEPDDPQ